MTIVFKVSDNIKEKMIEYYRDLKREKTPPYATFQADEAETVITLYESGKVVFQGESADIDANMWKDLEKSVNNRDIDLELNKENNKKDEEKDTRFIGVPTIGSDETGIGDYFGPVVVSATYVGKEHFNLLYDLGVKDSKKINDFKIMKIAPIIMKNIPYVSYILTNKEFNEKPTNMNKIKALLHNKALCSLLKKDNFNYKYIVVDQFCYPKVYFSHLKEVSEKCTNITFTTKAEDKVLSVAAASIISRYILLLEFKKLGDSLNIILKKGASNMVDQQGAMIVKKYGEKKLAEIAKLSFKNTDKIKAILKDQA
ncbi:MAG: ribonuclease HIII [Bacilli bacterium]|nr:ribonuclease HIII [Bacilli bacterium]